MAIVNVDQFQTSDGIYQLYYDTIAENRYVDFQAQGQGQQQAVVPDEQRGRVNGEKISEYCYGTTLLEFISRPNSPFFEVEQTPDSQTCTFVPPDDECDLIINSIVTTDETETGANDGTVQINASTSETGLQFSLDNSTWQSSNQYNNLAPGNYIVYVRDGGGCIQQGNFTINPAVQENTEFNEGLPVITLPNGNISRWSAAFNPINVSIQRKDFTVVSVEQNGTQASQLKLTLGSLLDNAGIVYAIEDAIYFKTPMYEFYGKALSHSVSSGKSVLIIPDLFVGYDTGGFANIPNTKQGYYIELQIISGFDPNRKNTITAEYTPNKAGLTKADLSGYLRSLVKPVDDFKYDVINWRDINLGASYVVKYREVWNTGNSPYYTAAYPLYVTYAAMQLGEQYGGNMANYVPFLVGSSARFLNDFNKPIYWQGLPFDLGFILSEYIVQKELYLETTTNGGQVINGLLLNADGSYILNADQSRFLIERNDNPSVNNVRVQEMIEQLGVNRLMLNDYYSAGVTELKINIYYLNGSNKVYVMQDTYVKIVNPCNDPYVYLKWINHLGGWSYYRFGYNQVLDSDINVDSEYQKYVYDWANQETLNDIQSKSSRDSITFGADNIIKNELEGLKWLKKSIKVQMLTDPINIKWQTVIINEGSFGNYNSRNNTGSVTFTATLRNDNIQEQ